MKRFGIKLLKKDNRISFKLNDEVSWRSKGQLKAGQTTLKIGKVVAVVAPGVDPYEKLPPYYKIQFCGGPRGHESYIVSVPGKYGNYLYWPKVSNLNIVG